MEKKTIKNTTEFKSEAGEQDVPATYVVITGGIQPDGVAALFRRGETVKDGVLFRFGLHYRQREYQTAGAHNNAMK